MLLPNQIKAAIKPYITGHFCNMPSFYSVLQSYSSFSQPSIRSHTSKPPHLFLQSFKTSSKPSIIVHLSNKTPYHSVSQPVKSLHEIIHKKPSNTIFFSQSIKVYIKYLKYASVNLCFTVILQLPPNHM